MVVNIIVNYCCTRVLLSAKMLKKDETEETRLFCHIFVIGSISIGECGRALWPPLAMPMVSSIHAKRNVVELSVVPV